MPCIIDGKKYVYVFQYESEKNLFKGKKMFDASSLKEAQDMFFDWLKVQSVYPHMWRLNFNVEEVEV